MLWRLPWLAPIGGVSILAGVGFDTATAIEMAEFAAKQGAHAVMVHQPVHPYRSDEGWVAYHKAIADAVPHLGIVPYVRDALIAPLPCAGWRRSVRIGRGQVCRGQLAAFC